jgi:dihydrofolate synthase/folylpolyglutamate synthase
MNYSAALAYLESLGTFGIQLGLKRIEALLAELGNPERRFRSIHVTGTNGKGSTTAILESILHAAGIRSGMYISPHLVDYPERMMLNGKEISRDEFAAVIGKIRFAAEAIQARGMESPTEFEVLTAAAFLWFAEKQVEMAVVEVGLGGLLDSTNVIYPEVSVITNVTLEHTDRCGSTVREIAAHKAGIIKAAAPVVTGAATDALAVIEAVAAQHQVLCSVLDRDFFVSEFKISEAGQSFVFSTPQTEAQTYRIGLVGRHQADNAALAIRACQCLTKKEPRLTNEAIQSGVAKARWPGRFEIFPGAPTVILDGAHNPDGVRILRRTLDAVYPGRAIVFVFGVLADKAHDEMARLLFRLFDRVIVVEPNSPRAASAAEIADEISGYVAAVTTADSIASGLLQAKLWAGPQGIVCVAGSLYMIGDARQLLLRL